MIKHGPDGKNGRPWGLDQDEGQLVAAARPPRSLDGHPARPLPVEWLLFSPDNLAIDLDRPVSPALRRNPRPRITGNDGILASTSNNHYYLDV